MLDAATPPPLMAAIFAALLIFALCLRDVAVRATDIAYAP